jgi:hypothetical protein
MYQHAIPAGVTGTLAPETPNNTPRLARQVVRVQDLMRDGVWRTLRDIAATALCSEASASARLRDLRKPEFGGYNVERRKTAVPGVYEYRIGPDFGL